MKNMTNLDAADFWQYFDENHPELAKQLPSRVFIDETIVVFQPAKMTDKDYSEFNRIKDEWLSNNGFR